MGKFISGPAILNLRAITDSDKSSQATQVDSDSMEPKSAANPASSLPFQLSYPPMVMLYPGCPGFPIFETPISLIFWIDIARFVAINE